MTTDIVPSLVDQHGDALFRFCLKLCGSRHDADDLWQETFLRVLERSSLIDRGRNPKGYLFSVCLNLWKSDRRRFSRREHSNVSADTPEALELDSGFNTEETVIRLEQSRRLHAMIDALEPKFRIPLYLYYTAEMSVDEAAAVLGLPSGTVKSRLYRARAKLQKRLESVEHEQ